MHHTYSLRTLPAIVAMGLIAIIASSCKDDTKEYVSADIDGEKTPTMKTRDVETLISDSGITRYRITTPLWLVFDEAKEPKWRFPDGLFIEKYDIQMQSDATVVCDSATYFSERKLWRLDGNVRMVNVAKDRFLTQQLFWNQNERKVYTDSFIHIERNDRTIEGYGFISNEQMTSYTVNQVSGIFPVSDFRHDPADSISSKPDSVATATPMTKKDEVKPNEKKQPVVRLARPSRANKEEMKLTPINNNKLIPPSR